MYFVFIILPNKRNIIYPISVLKYKKYLIFICMYVYSTYAYMYYNFFRKTLIAFIELI